MLPDATGTERPLPPPPEADAVYRAVLGFRDAARLREAIAREWSHHGVDVGPGIEARVTQAHYKPWERARLIVRVELARRDKPKPKVQFLYVQAYPSLEEARRRHGIAASKRPLRCVGPAAMLIREWSAVAWALPNGPLLRNAKAMLRRPAFARFLVEAGLLDPGAGRGPKPPELIRYVPRRRAVFRTKKALPGLGARAYVKIHSPGRDEIAAVNLRLAARAAAGSRGAFFVPELLAHVPRRRAIVMAELPGRRLSEIDPALGLDAHAATGRALAALHACGLQADATWNVEREIGELTAGTRDLAAALPALQAELHSLVDEIAGRSLRLRFPAVSFIHGNMFCDQVLVDDDARVGIVDWDDACMGDPLFDLGRLVANVIFLHDEQGTGQAAAEALVSSYAAVRGAIDDDRLRWHVATALLLRAKISALRPLPPGWISAVVRSVGSARAIMEGSDLPRASRAARAARTPSSGAR